MYEIKDDRHNWDNDIGRHFEPFYAFVGIITFICVCVTCIKCCLRRRRTAMFSCKLLPFSFSINNEND